MVVHLTRRLVPVALTVALNVALALAVSCSPPPDEPLAPESWEAAYDATETGWLMNVHGTAHDDRYAVGGAGTLGDVTGLIMHFDGAGWSPVELGVTVPLLNWIHGDGSGRYVVVGDDGTALHFDGQAWELMETPTGQNLWGVWGASMDDLWAVGGDAFTSDDLKAVVLRWDGAAWTELSAPTPLDAGDVYAWFKVWGSSASDVYVVGQKGAVLHWDGASLTELDVGAEDDLIAVWGTGPDRLALVGGRNNGIISRWDGAEWTTVKLAPLPGLNGVWMRHPDQIHIGGNYGTLSILDFDTLEPVQEVSLDTFHHVHALHGSPDGVLTAVGGNLIIGQGMTLEGIAYHRALGDDE